MKERDIFWIRGDELHMSDSVHSRGQATSALLELMKLVKELEGQDVSTQEALAFIEEEWKRRPELRGEGSVKKSVCN